MCVEHRHHSLASRQSVPERRHQQREREQVHPALLLKTRAVLLPRCGRLVLRSRWLELPRATSKARVALYEAHPRPSRTLRRRRISRVSQRVPHAR